MMKKTTYLVLFLFATILSINGQIKLPKLISDGMILQRDTNIKIWGWASPQEEITIHFLNNEYTISANNKGDWELQLPNLKAGGPFKMTLNGKNSIEINNILVGDVWLASGQSNMSFEMNKVSKLYSDEIENSTNTQIRQFLVPNNYNFKSPQEDFTTGNWVSVNPKTVGNFSAVAYFFAKKIHEENNIPIGIINSSIGGTPAQAWISKEAIKKFPHYYDETLLLKKDGFIKQIEVKNSNDLKEWIANVNANDLGLRNNWQVKDFDDSNWKTINLPNSWVKEIGYKQGTVWFRKSITLNKTPKSGFAALNLGRISDVDSVYVNGKFIGSTQHKFGIRNYTIPKGILKKGANTISIRVLSYRFNGGFIKGNPMNLTIDNKKIPLNNAWKLKLGAQQKQLDRPVQLTRKPVGLYNSMIAPLLNYNIKGVIWYQGEGNAGKAKEYNKLFPTLISNWRADFNQGDFPFLFVQLANYQKPSKQPTNGGWGNLREAQLNTLKLANTGMAVTIDIGEANDIHPKNKKDVGDRLAWEAQRVAYGSTLNPKSPMYDSMEVNGDSIVVSFTNSKDLKINGNKSLKHFAIAGTDQKFVWANALIKNNQIIVYSDAIANPVAVRYAWANNPNAVNLYDLNNMPISPFRTDNW